MPKHLITVDEAVAMLETVNASKETVRRFATQAGAVLARRPSLGDNTIVATSIYGHTSKQPGVNLSVGAVEVQMNVKTAQKVALDILGATEAAISDASVVALMTAKLGLDEQQAALVLLDLREIRQGTRGVVFEQ